MIAWLFVAWLAVPTIAFIVELASGLRPSKLVDEPPRNRIGRIAIVVPAHDEAAGISATLAALRATMPRGARLLVVADNCADDTAVLARVAGAEVIERDDPDRPGKGFALAFARDHLTLDPPEVAIVIDADCTADPGAIEALAHVAMMFGGPVQACYLMRPAPDRGTIVAMSVFAFLLKNRVRQRGLARLGAPAILAGSGMAFPWPVFATAPLATGDTVEDLALGIALTEQGHAARFLESAVVWTMPASRAATAQQRARWEQGFLATAFRKAPGLIASARLPTFWLGLHLLIPPLASLIMLHLASIAAMAMLGTPPAALAAELAMMVVLVGVLSIAWGLHGRPYLRWTALATIPFYLVWKLPIYAAALLRRPRRWHRTDR